MLPPDQPPPSDAYDAFVLPSAGGAFHTLCAIIRLDHADFARIGLHRPADGRAFDESDRQKLAALTHHIAGALRLQDLLAEAQLASATRAAALDQTCHATVITSASGAIVFANDAALRLERGGGLMLTSAGVTCADRAEAAKLASLIDSAAHGGPGGNTRISRGPKRPILAATVSPLPLSLADSVHVRAESRQLALVTIRDLGATSDAGQAALIDLFGLTGAEAAIVPQLLAGDSMSVIAQSRGVSAATVRAQSTRLLDKTGAANLRALATMIAALGCG